MNNTINKFLLAEDEFMPEMHLRQPGFTYSACGPFTKHKERIKKFEQTGDTQYIYRNELDKACFQHDTAYTNNKDLSMSTKMKISVNEKSVNENIKLVNELHKPIIRKFNKRKVYSSFRDNIWGADLGDMQLLTKFNKGIKYLLCVIDLFSKYAFVVPLKDKKRN